MPVNSARQPLVLINAVGMTGRLLPYAPRLQQLAGRGWQRPLCEVLPAVTSTAQASILTGRLPREHGIVANGWLYRDTMEVRFWQQSNRLLQSEPIYQRLRTLAVSQGGKFRCAKLFWWFNQGADVDIAVTPKPHYGADGNKIFDITASPTGLATRLKEKLGPFPFPSFWGPMAGLPATQWIACCAAEILADQPLDLTLVYLPHLDYDPQRYGPSGCDLPRLVGELDDALEPLLDAAREAGAGIWVVSEYGHCQVEQPIYVNRVLRQAGFLQVRSSPFGEILDTFGSRAFAVCDHQLCHVYVREPRDVSAVADRLRTVSGIDKIYMGGTRHEIGLDHSRSGELVVLSKPDRWLAYPYWLNDRDAPDFARTVDIHRKPGFDPCEMFFNPKIAAPKVRAALRLLQKKLGFRTLFDVIPLDASIVRGSHGLRAADPLDRPLLIGDGPEPPQDLSLDKVHGLLLERLG